MTKDEIKARIDGAKAELDSLQSGTGESSEPNVDVREHQAHLEKEIAGLQALLEEA